MIAAQSFIEPARARGFHFWTGVPCSYLKPFINYVIGDPTLNWVTSANEGDAVATASGHALAGRRAVAIMQNSGLGNAVSPLTSLNWVFRLPVLLIVTLRGDPGHGDEPQHELMGRITTDLLETMQVPWSWFPVEEADIEAALDDACRHMDTTGRPFALVMRKGTVAPHLLSEAATGPRDDWVEPGEPDDREYPAPTRREVLQAVIEATPVDGSVVVATTGFTGRELYAIDDRPNQLYVVGSMGCASAFGLGLSLARPDLQVVVADGDGAALMRMGNFATIGAYGGAGFHHVLLDNGIHESTGGQSTVSRGVCFAALAAACGYASAKRVACPAQIGQRLLEIRGPAFSHIHTMPGVPADLPRPSVKPADVCRRLMTQIGADAAWRAAVPET